MASGGHEKQYPPMGASTGDAALCMEGGTNQAARG